MYTKMFLRSNEMANLHVGALLQESAPLLPLRVLDLKGGRLHIQLYFAISTTSSVFDKSVTATVGI